MSADYQHGVDAERRRQAAIVAELRAEVARLKKAIAALRRKGA